MAKVETQHQFNGTISQVFNGVCQYAEYPDYVPGVTSTQILPAQEPGSSCQVRYEINLVKKFYYVLNMFESEPNVISWTLAESNVMKVNNGEWRFQELSKKKVLADYQVEATFRGLVPKALTDKVAKASIPGMLEGLQALIDAQS